MRDPEEIDAGRHLRLSMRSKILLMAIPFILCTLFLSITAAPLLMDLITEIQIVEDLGSNVSESDLNEPDDEYLTLYRNDFDTQDPYWHWEIYEGTASGTIREGYAFLNLTDSTTIEDNERVIGWSVHPTEGQGVWQYASMEVRLRCSDDNKLESENGGGIRCWGLKQEPEWPENMLAFLSWSPESIPEAVGFYLEAKVKNSVVLRVPLEVDMTEWHTYRILWEESNATFLVDGKVVGTTNTSPNVPMFGELFLQNLYRGESPDNEAAGFVDIVGNVSLQVDYIHLFTRKERFEAWSEEVSHAGQLIKEAEGRGINTIELMEYLAEAKGSWQEGYYNYEFSEPYLDKIVPYLEHFDEISEMFGQCSELIERSTEEGVTSRILAMMNGHYTQAGRYWEMYNYEDTLLNLQKIVDLAE